MDDSEGRKSHGALGGCCSEAFGGTFGGVLKIPCAAYGEMLSLLGSSCTRHNSATVLENILEITFTLTTE